MTDSAPTILYEDNHLLALLKPAGVLTMGDDTGDETMVDVAREYLRVKYNKPGNVFVGVVHRLDRPVSGVLLFARTSKAAARLSDQFRRGVVKKLYHAVVEGVPPDDSGTLVNWLLKDKQENLVACVSEDTPRAQKSVLNYQVIAGESGRTNLEIEPLTGRSHQIRVQLSEAGMPIIGDGKYGSRVRKGGRILLHAKSLEFEHPTKKERMRIEAPVDDA